MLSTCATFTDDILAIMEESERFLREHLGKRFALKEKSIGAPEQYLSNKVSKVTLENSVKCWRFRSSKCFQATVKNVENHRTKTNLGALLKNESL